MTASTETELIEQRIAYVLLRVALGVDFLGHGGVRLMHGSATFAQWMVKTMSTTPLPEAFVYSFGLVLPTIEAILGVLLLAGIATRWVATIGSLLILALMFGTALRQDWQGVALQLFYSLLFSILLFLRRRYDAGWMELIRG
ncbi:MAG TPA: DoxX family protein [Granulicella sp.]